MAVTTTASRETPCWIEHLLVTFGNEILGSNAVGHGHLERVYHTALARRLRAAVVRYPHYGIRTVSEECAFAIYDHGDCANEREIVGYCRPDLVVNEHTVVEVKATDRINNAALVQLQKYTRLTRHTAFLINFPKTIPTGHASSSIQLYKAEMSSIGAVQVVRRV